jgi:hypothetical protein
VYHFLQKSAERGTPFYKFLQKFTERCTEICRNFKFLQRGAHLSAISAEIAEIQFLQRGARFSAEIAEGVALSAERGHTFCRFL